MAVITPANLAPDTLPRVRGVILTRPWRGLWVVAKWPVKRGPPKTANQEWTVRQFAYAGRMAANPEPKSYETARFLTEGSHWLPRDVLTMVAYGKFYEVTLPDGTIAPQAYHGPPLAPEPDDMSYQWFPTNYATFYSATVSSSANATKGTVFTPSQNITITAAQALFNSVNGATYQMHIAELNGSNGILAITSSDPVTISGNNERLYAFDLSGVLTAGTRYGILLSRTDGANNYALPMRVPTLPQLLLPNLHQGAGVLAKALPTVGDGLTVTAGSTASLQIQVQL